MTSEIEKAGNSDAFSGGGVERLTSKIEETGNSDAFPGGVFEVKTSEIEETGNSDAFPGIPMQPVYAMLTGAPEYDIIKFAADTVYAHFGEKGYLRWQ